MAMCGRVEKVVVVKLEKGGDGGGFAEVLAMCGRVVKIVGRGGGRGEK